MQFYLDYMVLSNSHRQSWIGVLVKMHVDTLNKSFLKFEKVIDFSIPVHALDGNKLKQRFIRPSYSCMDCKLS